MPNPTPNQILQVAINSPLRTCFDYLAPTDGPDNVLAPGIRIQVPFRRKEVTGIIIDLADRPRIALSQVRQALHVLDDAPILSRSLLSLMKWASQYYHHPIGEVTVATLPRLLRSGGSIANQSCQMYASDNAVKGDDIPLLNSHQQNAINIIKNNLENFQVSLLDGVTGSGKTEVYLNLIAEVIKNKKQALVLVPEINLTPQLLARFAKRFTVPTVVLHSSLNDRERLNAWLAAKQGEAAIIIGTRSAIFTPLSALGIIIVDEEHDLSFKQQEGFRYSARDVAVVRGRLENIPVVLGSATPSLESLYNVRQARYQRLVLPQRAGVAIPPSYRLLDLRNQSVDEGLSQPLLQAMDTHLGQGGQTLLFLNRRGYAPVLMCHACGWAAKCRRCDVSLTLHHAPHHLLCHHCGTSGAVVQRCPDCQAEKLYSLGVGTERVEHALKKHFPQWEIVRIDRDSTRRKGSMETLLQKVHRKEGRILIGTQMLAKGHHFPGVTLVAILNTDSGLFSADFRASERMAQLLTQVAGRAGRADKPGEVLLQTHHPDHPLLLQLLREGYASFAETILAERHHAALPPNAHFALFRAEAVKRELPFAFLEQVRDMAYTAGQTAVQILGPIPSPMERRASRFRMQLLLQAKRRHTLHQLLAKLITGMTALKTHRQIRWSLDVDPMEMY